MLKTAYETLSDPELRAKYDATRSRHPSGPRPAQIISLEEFEELENESWRYGCRCGGHYVISEEMMEREQHIIGCNSCSEVVWVGYELAEDDVDER